MFILITGLLLGGTYALIALGLNLQYGVARIMNLANGELLVAGGFAAFWAYTAAQVSPVAALVLVAPIAFAVNWLIYRIMLQPLVTRAKSRGALEVDSILATFGMSFALVGIMTAVFGGGYFNYAYLSQPVDIFGSSYGQNRLVAFVLAAIIGLGLWLWLSYTRAGLRLRALAVGVVVELPDVDQLVQGTHITREITHQFRRVLGQRRPALVFVVRNDFGHFSDDHGIGAQLIDGHENSKGERNRQFTLGAQAPGACRQSDANGHRPL